MHYLASVYSVTIPLYVSGLLVAHHQEVVLVECQAWMEWNAIPSKPAGSRLRRTTRTSCRIYTLLPPDDGLLANPKHVEV
jgi:hypothetical protein